jgi:hypothetical protein
MTFKDREKGEEALYKHDQELEFKIRNRRNKLFGIWLAENHLGKSGEESMAYAKDVVMAAFENPGNEALLEKVKGDLAAAGVEVSDFLLEKHLNQCQATAKTQVMAE